MTKQPATDITTEALSVIAFLNSISQSLAVKPSDPDVYFSTHLQHYVTIPEN